MASTAPEHVIGYIPTALVLVAVVVQVGAVNGPSGLAGLYANVRAGTAAPYLIVVLLAVIVNNGSVPPVPVNKTVKVGLAGSLVVIVRVADSAPPTVGVNVTVIGQLDVAATFPPHVLTCVKSAAFGPVIEIPNVNPSVALVFDSVSGRALGVPSGTVPKDSASGDKVANPTWLVAVLDQSEVTTPLAQYLASGLNACTR